MVVSPLMLEVVTVGAAPPLLKSSSKRQEVGNLSDTYVDETGA
jgi:hypothetical protein